MTRYITRPISLAPSVDRRVQSKINGENGEIYVLHWLSTTEKAIKDITTVRVQYSDGIQAHRVLLRMHSSPPKQRSRRHSSRLQLQQSRSLYQGAQFAI